MLLSTRNAKWRIAVGAISLGLIIGAGVYSLIAMPQNHPRPFLAKTVVRLRQPNGAFKDAKEITQAVRSDGSTVTDTVVLANGRSPTVSRELWLVPTRTYWNYDPRTNLVTYAPIDGPRYLSLTATAASACLSALPGPGSAKCTPSNETLLGYAVWTLSREFAAADGAQVRIEQQVAPALDWRPVQSSSYRNGTLAETQTVVALAESEPAQSLFAPPSGPPIFTLAEYLDLTLTAWGPKTVVSTAALGVQRRAR